jgi:RNA polymerase sigma factor (sigma-70 family)
VTSLTGRLAAGDEDAFFEFHTAFFDRLYRFLLVIARGNEDQAREALQLTLLRVLRYIRVFNTEDAFWSWLKVVARSAARDAGRKQHRYAALLNRFAEWWRNSVGNDSGIQRDEENQLRCALEESLEELAQEDRELLERKYVDGSTSQVLADRGKGNRKALESRILRLRLNLRARILEKLRST